MNRQVAAGRAPLALLGIVALVATLVAACSGTSNPSDVGLPASLQFAFSPIPIDAIEFTVPIGNLNPPSHTLPTDHAYLYHRLFNPSAPTYDVLAPAGGTVREVRRGNDDLLRVQASKTMTYYLGHVLLDANLTTGMTIVAGQHVGRTSNLSFGIDLGLINDDLTLAFLSPGRYSTDTLHADSPFKYFAEPLRTALYAKERGNGEWPDGKIDFDLAGTLAGNWFLDGLSGIQSTAFESGEKQLAFVRDVERPSEVRIAIGGTLSMAGPLAVSAGAPDPASITPASGKVGYRLLVAGSVTLVQGLLMVEMTDAQHLRAETFPGSQAASAEFTSAARVYAR